VNDVSLTTRAKALAPYLTKYMGVCTGCSVLNVLLTIALQFVLPLPVAAALAFIVAGQVSFVLNAKWTYHDRPSAGLLLRWVLFTLGNVFFGWVVERGALAWVLNQSWLYQGVLQDDILARVLAYIIAASMVWPGNLTWNHCVVFRHPAEPVQETHNTPAVAASFVRR
jgi:putative flippase GtrA